MSRTYLYPFLQIEKPDLEIRMLSYYLSFLLLYHCDQNKLSLLSDVIYVLNKLDNVSLLTFVSIKHLVLSISVVVPFAAVTRLPPTQPLPPT